MRYLSLCSGIEAASVAWMRLGWQPVAFAEHEPGSSDGGFAAALLAHRFPGVPNLGALERITSKRLEALGPIDVIIGGTPCQDLSVAGRRAGLAGARSSLFHHYTRIVHAARRVCGTRWAVWENVPGAFSSNQGRDFAHVVGALAGCEVTAPVDGWRSEGVALGDDGLVEWAVLDTQWFGLAQRRDRVFVVADFGDWTARAPVLLEPESLRGDSAPRREAGARVAGTLGARSLDGSGTCGGDGRESFLVAGALTSHHLRGVPEAEDEGENNFRTRNVLACFDTTQITHPENRSTAGPDTAHVSASAHPPAVVFKPSHYTRDKDGAPSEVCPPLTADADKGDQDPALYDGVDVRRLTPRECERLFGFPDDWTLVPYRGKPATDTPRYAALGNSIGIPPLEWIGRRIAAT